MTEDKLQKAKDDNAQAEMNQRGLRNDIRIQEDLRAEMQERVPDAHKEEEWYQKVMARFQTDIDSITRKRDNLGQPKKDDRLKMADLKEIVPAGWWDRQPRLSLLVVGGNMNVGRDDGEKRPLTLPRDQALEFYRCIDGEMAADLFGRTFTDVLAALNAGKSESDF